MKNLYASHMRLVYFQRFFAFFSFLFLDSWIEILDILLNNNASHSRFVSSLASSRLESSETLRLLREEEEERTKR